MKKHYSHITNPYETELHH